MPEPRALLDACVLVPMVKADVLLEFAHQGAYHPLWSGRILDEVARAVPTASRGRVTLEKARRRTEIMDETFQNAGVEHQHELELRITGLPDPDDRHVVAAAISGRASVIVTENLRHFPNKEFELWGLRVVSSDEFLVDLLSSNQQRALDCLKTVSERRKNPPQEMKTLLANLER